MTSQTLLPSGKIDIHGFTRKLRTGEASLLRDETITERNKQLILQFLRDCELGKTVKRSQKKRIGKARQVKYLGALRQLALWMNMDFDKVTQREMEDLVLGIENNGFLKRDGTPYTESVKRDFKVCLRKFYKWLFGNNEVYPELVQWIDTREVVPEVSALSREEIERMSEYAASPMERAVVWGLFDSGARAEEFLNIRYRHLEETTTEDGQTIYKVRIEFSKTKPRTILLPIASKYWQSHLSNWKEREPETQVFSLPYSSLGRSFVGLGRSLLGKGCIRI